MLPGHPPALALRGKVLVAGGCRGDFCEKLLDASPMSDRASATGSKTDPLLAKAKLISHGGCASEITCLNRGGNTRQLQPERGVRIWERSSSAEPRVGAEGGQEVLQVLEQRVPCSHGGPPGSRAPLAARGGPHAGAGGCPEEAVTLGRARAGAGSWQELWTHGEKAMPEQFCWQGL